MEHLLQKVSGAKVMSFLDGFSGYNQVVVHPDDQEKTAFTTRWGTFMYSKMPFGLVNARATFQRAIDITFVGEKDWFVLIYLDDIIMYSSSHQDHFQHLKKVFLKCRRFGISVNHKKSQFALEEGKFLGHVVSVAESYNGSSYFDQPRLQKGVPYIFFASDETLAEVLLQVDEEGLEHPVAFFSKTLRDAEFRYDIIEKHAYAFIKSLKDFRVYILHSKVIAYVPFSSMKDVLMQPNADGRRAKWIAKLIEFNIELKPTKLFRGQGLARLMVEENCRMLDMNLISTNSDDGHIEGETVEPGKNQSLAENLAFCEWYFTIAQFLLKLEVPPSLSSSQARTIKLRAAKYCTHENLLYWRDPSRVLLRCLEKEQSMEVMQQFHSSICGGHHYWKTTTHKILKAG
eukprot:PITA_18230